MRIFTRFFLYLSFCVVLQACARDCRLLCFVTRAVAVAHSLSCLSVAYTLRPCKSSRSFEERARTYIAHGFLAFSPRAFFALTALMVRGFHFSLSLSPYDAAAGRKLINNPPSARGFQRCNETIDAQNNSEQKSKLEFAHCSNKQHAMCVFCKLCICSSYACK